MTGKSLASGEVESRCSNGITILSLSLSVALGLILGQTFSTWKQDGPPLTPTSRGPFNRLPPERERGFPAHLPEKMMIGLVRTMARLPANHCGQRAGNLPIRASAAQTTRMGRNGDRRARKDSPQKSPRVLHSQHAVGTVVSVRTSPHSHMNWTFLIASWELSAIGSHHIFSRKWTLLSCIQKKPYNAGRWMFQV